VRLSCPDVMRLAASGLRARPLRALLSALGIAIGVAAMLAVVGVSSSGRADLQQVLDALGTNLLSVEGGKTDQAQLPATATTMIERIPPVLGAAALSRLPDTIHVYRSERVPAEQTNGIIPYATDLDLPSTVGAGIADGAWLNPATATYPGVVLGHESARRLGIAHAGPEVLIQIGDLRFAVLGILHPVPLVPALDSAALIGVVAAQRYLHTDGHPTTIFVRATDDQVTAVWGVLSATANPEAPYLVTVSRPSDALAAKLATERAFNGLLLGLGAVALLVGGVGAE
jgi:putative ABC transport system permease protein